MFAVNDAQGIPDTVVLPGAVLKVNVCPPARSETVVPHGPDDVL